MFAEACVPLDGAALPEVGIVESVELFTVMDRVELASVVDVMFTYWAFVVFWGSTAEVAVELAV